VGRAGPANVEEVFAVEGVVCGALEDALLELLAHESLLRGDEDRAERDALRAERERCGKAPPVRDPARRQHRQGRDGVDDRRQGYEQAVAAEDVAARFDTLSDHRVDAPSCRREGIEGRADLNEDADVVCMRVLDEWRRIPREEHHQRDALGHDRLEVLEEPRGFLRVVPVALRDDQVHAERPVCQLACARDPLAHEIRWEAAAAEHAEPACVRYRRCKLWASARGESHGEDRMLDPEHLAERRRRHAAFLLSPGAARNGPRESYVRRQVPTRTAARPGHLSPVVERVSLSPVRRHL
jgi:hypothetical protein